MHVFLGLMAQFEASPSDWRYKKASVCNPRHAGGQPNEDVVHCAGSPSLVSSAAMLASLGPWQPVAAQLSPLTRNLLNKAKVPSSVRPLGHLTLTVTC